MIAGGVKVCVREALSPAATWGCLVLCGGGEEGEFKEGFLEEVTAVITRNNFCLFPSLKVGGWCVGVGLGVSWGVI